jgi:PGF-CTERM protein
MSRSSVGVITAILVVSVLAPAAVGGATAQEDSVVVTVSLVDSNGDSGGSGVNFTVSWDEGSKNETTLANGREYIEVPNGSNIEVEITDEEYIRNRPYQVRNVGEQTVEVPVALSGQATITVEDGSDNPVPDAEVRVREGSTIETLTTDASGQVTTDRLEQRSAANAYELTVRKPGYFDLDTSLAVTGDVNETVTLRSGTKTLNFRVVDDHFDPPRPIEDARVRIPDLSYSSQTFETGRTSTSVRVNSEYTVQVNKDGYSTTGKRVTVEEEPVNVTVAITRSKDLSIVSDNDRVVVGETTDITVTDEYGEPVPNAQVTIGGQAVGQTDDNGEYEVPIDTAGNVTIEVADAGQTASLTIEGVGGGGDTTPTTPDTPETPTTPDTPETPTTQTPTTPDETTPDDGGNDTTTGENGPGFGVAATIAALVGTILLARRR